MAGALAGLVTKCYICLRCVEGRQRDLPRDLPHPSEMPYSSNQQLPQAVREHLPGHAQDIFRQAFNSAFEQYAGRAGAQREQLAFRVAWAAVKRSYRKQGESWVARSRQRG